MWGLNIRLNEEWISVPFSHFPFLKRNGKIEIHWTGARCTSRQSAEYATLAVWMGFGLLVSAGDMISWAVG